MFYKRCLIKDVLNMVVGQLLRIHSVPNDWSGSMWPNMVSTSHMWSFKFKLIPKTQLLSCTSCVSSAQQWPHVASSYYMEAWIQNIPVTEEHFTGQYGIQPNVIIPFTLPTTVFKWARDRMLANKTWESLDKWLEKGFHVLKRRKKLSKRWSFFCLCIILV